MPTYANGTCMPQTTVWDYVAHKTDNAEFAKAVKALHSSPQASRTRNTGGKAPVVLHNMCATCREDKTGQHPGQIPSPSTLALQSCLRCCCRPTESAIKVKRFAAVLVGATVNNCMSSNIPAFGGDACVLHVSTANS